MIKRQPVINLDFKHKQPSLDLEETSSLDTESYFSETEDKLSDTVESIEQEKIEQAAGGIHVRKTYPSFLDLFSPPAFKLCILFREALHR